MPGMSALRRGVRAGANFLRTAWQIVGFTLALVVVIELGVRLQVTVRDAMAGPRASVDPRAKYDWYAGFTRDFDATRKVRWLPYLYFGRLPSYHGPYVNIDSLGHRITPQPRSPEIPRARVFFFGGSTMWGNSQRDDHTIPAEASRRLQPLAGPGERIEITNFGENGYVMTQGIIQLVLQLRAGNRPDVVVFYDGLNDAGATIQSGVPGLPQNESKRVAEFAMGRALDRTGFEQGFRKDARALEIIVGQGGRQLAAVEWLQSSLLRPATTFIAAKAVARGTVGVYRENVRLVEALARSYGFTPIYVWQPNVHATPKPLSPYEERIARQIQSDAFQRRLREVHLAIPALLDSAMANVAPGRFINATTLFRGDTTHMFVDWIGHTSETATPIIVDAFWPQLAAAVNHSLMKTQAEAPHAVPSRDN